MRGEGFKWGQPPSRKIPVSNEWLHPCCISPLNQFAYPSTPRYTISIYKEPPMEPTNDNLAVYFPSDNQPNSKQKKPHQRARLVRIAQGREEMARVYNYMLRGFNAKFVQLQRD